MTRAIPPIPIISPPKPPPEVLPPLQSEEGDPVLNVEVIGSGLIPGVAP